MNVPTIGADEIPDEAVLLDVREDEEWAAGHIAGAVHVPMMRVPNQLVYGAGELTSGRPVIVLCAHGSRSAQVTAWLRHQGVDATNLMGGMHAWEQSGRPMVSETGAPAQVL